MKFPALLSALLSFATLSTSAATINLGGTALPGEGQVTSVAGTTTSTTGSIQYIYGEGSTAAKDAEFRESLKNPYEFINGEGKKFDFSNPDDVKRYTRGARWFWRMSQVALVAGSAIDAHSSYGKRELNPILKGSDGRFDGRSTLIKSAITGGMILWQELQIRKLAKGKPHDQKALMKFNGITNSAMAGLFIGIAKRNYGVQK